MKESKPFDVKTFALNIELLLKQSGVLKYEIKTDKEAWERRLTAMLNRCFYFYDQVRSTEGEALLRDIENQTFLIEEELKEQTEGTNIALDMMKDIKEVAIGIKDGSTEMLEGNEAVADEMKKLDSLTRIISDSMNEMTKGAVEITDTIIEANNITQKNKASIDSLVSVMNKFKV